MCRGITWGDTVPWFSNPLSALNPTLHTQTTMASATSSKWAKARRRMSGLVHDNPLSHCMACTRNHVCVVSSLPRWCWWFASWCRCMRHMCSRPSHMASIAPHSCAPLHQRSGLDILPFANITSCSSSRCVSPRTHPCLLVCRAAVPIMYKLPEPAVLSLLHHVVEHMQVSTRAPTVTM